jgi:bifunctional non-homologous end joining protein LigD
VPAEHHSREPVNQQLALPLQSDGDLSTLPVRLGFAMATEGGSPFDDEAHFFEPWWPGAPAQVRRLGDHIEMRTEHLTDPLATFPELASLSDSLAADGVIVQGTLLALDSEGRPDADLLRRRLRGEDDTPSEGAFVASDLLYLEAQPLVRKPFVERRGYLADMLTDSDHCVVGRGLVGEGITLGLAVASLGLAAVSARRLDARWRAGPAGDRWLRLPVATDPAEATRPFLVLLEKLPLDD